jgi:hypothetical protein
MLNNFISFINVLKNTISLKKYLKVNMSRNFTPFINVLKNTISLKKYLKVNNVNAVLPFGSSILLLACEMQEINCIYLLLQEPDLNVSHTDCMNENAIFKLLKAEYSFNLRHVEIILKKLICLGCPVINENKFGLSIIYRTLRTKNGENILSILIDNGVYLTKKFLLLHPVKQTSKDEINAMIDKCNKKKRIILIYLRNIKLKNENIIM